MRAPPRWETVVDALPASVRNLTIPGLNHGWVFRFRVVARNAKGWGLASPASGPVLAPPPPVLVTTWRRDCNGSGARIGWTTPDFPFLRLLRSGVRQILSGEVVPSSLAESRGVASLRQHAEEKWND